MPTIKRLETVEREHILYALELCAWNRTLAAKFLDMPVRTLRQRLSEYRKDPRYRIPQPYRKALDERTRV